MSAEQKNESQATTASVLAACEEQQQEIRPSLRKSFKDAAIGGGIALGAALGYGGMLAKGVEPGLLRRVFLIAACLSAGFAVTGVGEMVRTAGQARTLHDLKDQAEGGALTVEALSAGETSARKSLSVCTGAQVGATVPLLTAIFMENAPHSQTAAVASFGLCLLAAEAAKKFFTGKKDVFELARDAAVSAPTGVAGPK